MDIERLVTWALRDQGLGWDRSGSSAQGSGGGLGTRISGGAIADPSIGLLSDEDALIVKQAIDGLPKLARGLVIQFGRTGLRPAGADDAIGEPQQLVDKRGRARWEYDNPKTRRGPRRPLLDMLGWSRHKEAVEDARKEWTLWRESLVALREALSSHLKHHIATGPEAPAEPWSVAKPVVHGLDQHEPSHEPQPWLKPDVTMPVDNSVTIGELRERAAEPVRSVASDWGMPTQPINRRRRRKAVEKRSTDSVK